MPSPAHLPSYAVPPYQESEWRPLINACRQRSQYRFGALLPGHQVLADLPPAGEGGRWFIVPAGAVLLAPSGEGRWAWLSDLQDAPLHLGPFVLSWRPPLTEKTAQERQRTQEVRTARRELRGTRVPNLAPLPQGGRLVLAVAGAFVGARKNELALMARRQARLPKEKGNTDLWRGVPQFIASINGMTEELGEASRYAWVETGSIRSWNAAAHQVAMQFLVARGMKPKPARAYVAQYLRAWWLRGQKPAHARPRKQEKTGHITTGRKKHQGRAAEQDSKPVKPLPRR